jgi:hypothetical protein
LVVKRGEADMKLNASALRSLLLCGLLPLSPGSASAKPSQTPNIQGTYALDAAASDDVHKAIDGAVKGMSRLIKGIAHSRLEKTNVPYQRIVISFTPCEVSITTDQWATIVTCACDTPVDWTRKDGEKFKVSTVWENGKLKQTFKGEDGQRTNIYSISADGKTLTMHVSVTSPRLKQPLMYKQIYRRTA